MFRTSVALVIVGLALLGCGLGNLCAEFVIGGFECNLQMGCNGVEFLGCNATAPLTPDTCKSNLQRQCVVPDGDQGVTCSGLNGGTPCNFYRAACNETR
jgi:hypothetical protein